MVITKVNTQPLTYSELKTLFSLVYGRPLVKNTEKWTSPAIPLVTLRPCLRRQAFSASLVLPQNTPLALTVSLCKELKEGDTKHSLS